MKIFQSKEAKHSFLTNLQGALFCRGSLEEVKNELNDCGWISGVTNIEKKRYLFVFLIAQKTAGAPIPNFFSLPE